ncbi:MAG: hypothetical protein H6673_04795 [Anaerolineales bacterium]|nr:hypothetical protein [Anaerolineales bacterium]
MRLPPDNFPDDTETYAFHHYQVTAMRWRRWVVIIGGGIGLVAGLVGLMWVLLHNQASGSTESPNVPDYITPTPDVSQTMPEGFPPDIIDPQIIRIPARIDEIGIGRRGYVFQSSADLLWCIAVFGGTAQVYGNTEAVAGECMQGAATTELLVKLDQNAVYGLVVETTDVESVMFILPIE